MTSRSAHPARKLQREKPKTKKSRKPKQNPPQQGHLPLERQTKADMGPEKQLEQSSSNSGRSTNTTASEIPYTSASSTNSQLPAAPGMPFNPYPTYFQQPQQPQQPHQSLPPPQAPQNNGVPAGVGQGVSQGLPQAVPQGVPPGMPYYSQIPYPYIQGVPPGAGAAPNPQLGANYEYKENVNQSQPLNQVNLNLNELHTSQSSQGSSGQQQHMPPSAAMPLPVPPAAAQQGAARNTAPPPRKRALTACDTCRSKKIKCDNARPRCGTCVKNGTNGCHYRTDEAQKDYTSYDPASLSILSKLDVLLKEVNDLKTEAHKRELEEPKRKMSRTNESANPPRAEKCVWDMSTSSLFKWRYLTQTLRLSQSEVDGFNTRLIKDYNNSVVMSPKLHTLEERFEMAKSLELLLSRHFTNLINSFFINIHTKVPVLDSPNFFESLVVYKLFMNYDPAFQLCDFLQLYSPNEPPSIFFTVLSHNKIDDSRILRKAFKNLCKSIPLIVIICALGAIATPVQLDNLTRFATSIEERDSFAIGAFSEEDAFTGLPPLPQSRLEISFELLSYSKFLGDSYPFTLKQSSLRMVVYQLLESQYYLCSLSPLLAYKNISAACQTMMYYLEMKKVPRSEQNSSEENHNINPRKKEVVDRIFWTVLKLECELRVEISPHVPASGITQVTPPTSFPKSADFVPEIQETEDGGWSNSATSLQLASNYYDEYSWYYFLTEIAVRKVDNSMFDEIYHFGHQREWDSLQFANEDVWTIFVKYLNQYNGIINSLSPRIRNFLLQEDNVDQIYWGLKKKRKERREGRDPEAQYMDDFLVDDDLLLMAQSESIIHIKGRVVVSKLYMFRPIIYLLLEDKIPFMDLLTAAMSVIKGEGTENVLLETPDSSSGAGSTTNTETEANPGIDYYNLINANMYYQRQYPDENFSSFIQYKTTRKETNEGQDDLEESNDFTLRDLPQVKIRVLKVFIQNLIAMPKLVMPKLGAHRHPGSWYYLRNQFNGNMYQFLLYNKINEMFMAAAQDERMSQELAPLSGMIEMIMPKQGMIASFEHSIMLYQYWLEESKDCGVYIDYTKRCLDLLQR